MLINVLDYLDDSARRYPENIYTDDNESKYSFSQFREKAYTIGTYIAAKEIFRKPIAVFLPKNNYALLSFMGIASSGNFYCPIDTDMPVERINRIITILMPAAIITDKANEDAVASVQFGGEIILIENALAGRVDFACINNIREKMIDTDPLYVLFTSGSTGVPKGVLINHRSVIDCTEWVSNAFSISENSVFGNQGSFHFDLSIPDIFCTMKNGGKIDIIPRDLFVFPIKLIEYMNKKGINTIVWVPSALCVVANSRALQVVEPKYLDKVLFCGEVMPNKQLNIWRRMLPNILYANLYGPTEITFACTYYIVDRAFQDDEPLPIGIPYKNTGILVLNEQDKPMSRDEIGELCVRGTSLSAGYYNNPQKTAEAFVQNPCNTAYPEYIYRTGDLVKYNEQGELIYISRKDFQIKHMGQRIELGEIETVAFVVEGIEECACIYDDVRKRIVLIYSGEKLDVKTIVSALSKKMQEYMIPKIIIHVSQLPHNANGKIDRKKLKELCSQNLI